MRYENPVYMAEDAAAADLLAGGRLQLGLGRGSSEPAWRRAEAFGYSVDSEDAREKTALFRAAIAGSGVVRADVGGRPGNAMLPRPLDDRFVRAVVDAVARALTP
jgi:alkanesulfonate monooxygenase SsuD/methylene tetrahydromethanopterin reductase-like flavin-dependent oxidoreductase (luciferase family)